MKTKSPHPISLLDGIKTHPLIEVYFEFAQLKQLYRQGWLKRSIPSSRCESVADHSMGVAVLAMFISEVHFPDLDALKILRMSLIHDFGEIYAGDVTPDDQIDQNKKYRTEREAVKKVFSKLPQGAEYIALWEEYEKRETPEARFVRQVDRLEMGLQASIYQAQGLTSTSEFFESAKKVVLSPELKEIIEELEEQFYSKR
ncbi:MAG: HD domain-containing protein [Anaerolineaceae bacterium]|jgi:putative hydrolase of HD superfamily|nr:HD domain-containing protein [Anaerolineaceae bacterium]